MLEVPYEKLSTPKNQKIKPKDVKYFDEIRKEKREAYKKHTFRSDLKDRNKK